ncbi:MAG: transposase [Candidatus Woesearchaeota archaeon]|jgi:hypothetical protein
MSKSYQVKLSNFLNPDSTPLTASEIICGIDINDLFNVEEGFILPPDAAHCKYKAIDYGKFLVYHIVKGHHTLKKTYKHLQNHPHELKQLGFEILPEYVSIISFTRLRLGKEAFAELRNAVTEYLHNNEFFVRDNIDAQKAKRNSNVIYSTKTKKLVKAIKKVLLDLIKQNKIVNESYSNKDILWMIMDTICEERGSLFGYTKRKRNDYQYYHRGNIPTSHTLFNRLRQIFESDEVFNEFLLQVTKKILSLVRKYNPDLFNRTKPDVAIDTILIATWESNRKSPDSNSILRDSHVEQKGTNKFREYDCISIVLKGYKFVLGFIPLKEGDKNNKERNIEKLILRARSLIPIDTVLMDKEFETYSIIQLLQSMNIKFITPTKRTPDVLKLINTQNKPIQIYKRVIHDKAVANLIIIRKQIGPMEYESLPYTTNIEYDEKTASQIIDKYKTRWNIETNFRDVKVFKTLTTSRDTHIRNIFFGTATIMINLWILANLIAIFLYIKQLPQKPIIEKITFKKHFEGPIEITS